MRGGVTIDTVRWVGTVPGLDGLAIECPGQSDRAHCQYLHTQPEDTDGQTTNQLKYTWEVVVRVSNLVLQQLIADGKLTEAPKVEAAPLRRIRQKRPPLIAEELGDGGPRIVQEDGKPIAIFPNSIGQPRHIRRFPRPATEIRQAQ